MYIEKTLKTTGIQVIKPRTSAIVKRTKIDTLLKEDAIQAFEAVGGEIGAVLVSKSVPIELQDQTVDSSSK